MSAYADDLAYIHHAGFTGFAIDAAPGILEMLWRGGIREGLVVDAGCGSGVWGRELARAGFEVFGFDRSAAMVAIARELAPGIRFEQASIEDVVLPSCVAITAIGEVLSYGSTLESLRDFFSRAHAALGERGMLIFDLAERESAAAHFDRRRIEGEDWVVIVVQSLQDDLLTRHITTYRQLGDDVRKSEETHTLRLYDRFEIAALLRELGFLVKVRRSYGTRRLPPGHAVFVGTKR
jgi:SAM-dependent methyltransferase